MLPSTLIDRALTRMTNHFRFLSAEVKSGTCHGCHTGRSFAKECTIQPVSKPLSIRWQIVALYLKPLLQSSNLPTQSFTGHERHSVDPSLTTLVKRRYPSSTFHPLQRNVPLRSLPVHTVERSSVVRSKSGQLVQRAELVEDVRDEREQDRAGIHPSGTRLRSVPLDRSGLLSQVTRRHLRNLVDDRVRGGIGSEEESRVTRRDDFLQGSSVDGFLGDGLAKVERL